MLKGKINKLIPFSSVDGPGNRFAVFLQGCQFNCLYCHNPETINHCLHCAACIPFCQNNALELVDGRVVYHPKNCVACDECIKNCPHHSSPKILELTAEEVMAEVRKVRAFIRGITVSGGECTLQKDFLIELLQLAKQDGLSALIDSNGGVPLWNESTLMSLTDGVMLDVKAFDEAEHQRLTGVTNQTVLENMVYLAKTGKLAEVRTVVSERGLDNERTIDSVSKMLAELDCTVPYKLIKYRPFGVRKEYLDHLVRPSDAYMQQLSEIVRGNGLENVAVV